MTPSRSGVAPLWDNNGARSVATSRHAGPRPTLRATLALAREIESQHCVRRKPSGDQDYSAKGFGVIAPVNAYRWPDGERSASLRRANPMHGA
ncbi:hypothetical protein HPB47_008050 [Ixodes persulcatus]|uniref:Uncharacterized protein n=1 Tax=Ixodes persulcatus TaxID=34615 RepID=A0AC60P623_IXOPE|nr:hypothetical protein HPB47_008050 [Ixodes persulcatus]